MLNKLVLYFLIFLCSCQNFDYQSKGKDVPTTGNILIGADYGDSFLLNELIEVFEDEYQNADIQPRWSCEIELLKNLQEDSLQFVLLNRDFSAEEKAGLVSRDIKIRSVKIAQSSIAVIVHPDNPIKQISQLQLQQLLSGVLTKWPTSSMSLFPSMDGTCGSVYNELTKFIGQKSLRCRSEGFVKTPLEVINYVSRNIGSIGFVNVNWIADKSDSFSIRLSKMVKVLKVENRNDQNYYYPYQSQIKTSNYPLLQHVYLHDLQGYNGLAAGFMAFVSSQQGQILVKKSGLIPFKDHGRTIVIGEE